MSKRYKISYKTYFNERLKQVSFHGLLSYPLYLQITFERKTIFYKSYYFELFLKTRYSSIAGIKTQHTLIEKIIKKETELINFIIEKNISSFSLNHFKEQYDYYCKDLLDEMEPIFLDYLKIFFQHEELPVLGDRLQHGLKVNSAFELVEDLKKALMPSLYQKLVNNSLYYGPPYIPLYSLMLLNKKALLPTITIREWKEQNMEEKFLNYLDKNYSSVNARALLKKLEEYLNASKSK